jgi:hypothetical protein
MQASKSWTTSVEPTSYKQIYVYIERALQQCSTLITEAEIDYYQESSLGLHKAATKTRSLSIVTLSAWSQPLHDLLISRSLDAIRSGTIIRELMADEEIAIVRGHPPDKNLALMKRILDKTTEQFHSRIPTIITSITECMNLMEQYFLSFYEIAQIEDIILNKIEEIQPVSRNETMAILPIFISIVK